jgi:hypothetical protein
MWRGVLAALVVGAAAASEAGIVVLDDGAVFLGTINPSEVRSDHLLLRDPQGADGVQRIDLGRVRWYDVEADTLTDDYFARHLDAPLLGARWQELRRKWIDAQGAADPSVDVVPFDVNRLDAIPIHGDGFALRKPAGWKGEMRDGILVLQAPRAVDGFAPRIHVFVTPASDEADAAGQLDWIRAELSGLSSKARFRVLEEERLKSVTSGGSNQRLLTETALPSRTVHTLRQVSFRATRTVFFSAYGDQRSFQRVEPLLRASLETLELREDG